MIEASIFIYSDWGNEKLKEFTNAVLICKPSEGDMINIDKGYFKVKKVVVTKNEIVLEVE